MTSTSQLLSNGSPDSPDAHLRDEDGVAGGGGCSHSPLLPADPSSQPSVAGTSSNRDSDPLPVGSTAPRPPCMSTGSRPGRGKACSVQIREPPVSETSRGSVGGGGGYTVVRSEEKHGPLQRAIPTMPFCLAVVACIFNIVIPGTGTLISAFSVLCCGTTSRVSSRLQSFLLNVLSGLLQFATFLLIVGWIWSITWGMTFVQLAMSAKENRERSPVPYYVRRHSSVE